MYKFIISFIFMYLYICTYMSYIKEGAIFLVKSGSMAGVTEDRGWLWRSKYKPNTIIYVYKNIIMTYAKRT